MTCGQEVESMVSGPDHAALLGPQYIIRHSLPLHDVSPHATRRSALLTVVRHVEHLWGNPPRPKILCHPQQRQRPLQSQGAERPLVDRGGVDSIPIAHDLSFLKDSPPAGLTSAAPRGLRVAATSEPSRRPPLAIVQTT
jgi:hypothetical protein